MTFPSSGSKYNAARILSFKLIRRTRPRALSAFLVAILLLAIGSSSAFGGVVNYGNFFGNTVDFLGVQEQSASFPNGGPGLYRQPILANDALFFSPVGFRAESNLGVAQISVDHEEIENVVEVDIFQRHRVRL